jgi:hypothetical protein
MEIVDINLRHPPFSTMMTAVEYQYGRRDNFSGGFHSTAIKNSIFIQIQFRKKFLQAD